MTTIGPERLPAVPSHQHGHAGDGKQNACKEQAAGAADVVAEVVVALDDPPGEVELLQPVAQHGDGELQGGSDPPYR